MTSTKKLTIVAIILSIVLVFSIVGMVVVLVLSGQKANVAVNIKYKVEDAWVEVSATAYVGDSIYTFNNGEIIELSPTNMEGELSQDDDEIILDKINPKIIFEYVFKNKSTSVDAVIKQDEIPETQKNIKLSYAFYNKKQDDLTTLITYNEYSDQLLAAYDNENYNFRYIYVVAEIESLVHDALLNGNFIWGISQTFDTQSITIDNSSAGSISNTVAKTFANNLLFEPPYEEVTNMAFAGFYTDSAFNNPVEFPYVAEGGTTIYARYEEGNIPASNISYDDASNSYVIEGLLDSNFTGDTLVIPDVYNGPNGELPVTSIAYEFNEYSAYYDGLLYSNTTVTHLYIGNNITDISGLAVRSFNSNYQGSNITLKHVEVGRGVTRLNNAFYNCSSLETLKVSDNLTGVYLTNYWEGSYPEYYSCGSELRGTKLTVIQPYDNEDRYILVATADATSTEQIENFDKVTEVADGAFYMSKLSSLVVPSCVINVSDYLFAESNLQSITLHSGIKSIGFESFVNCEFLTSVVISYNVKEIGSNAFLDCDNLTSIRFEDAENWEEKSGSTWVSIDVTNPQANATKFKNGSVALRKKP